MSNFHYIISKDGSISVFIDGQDYVVNISHPAYNKIREEINKTNISKESLAELLNVNKAIERIFKGKVLVDLNEQKVFYDGSEFHDKEFCKRILSLMREGQDPDYLINFLNNLCENPSYRATMETFKFIQQEGMPITSDGCFIAYKGVRNDYKDVYSGEIDNTPDGREIGMPRDNVCDDSSDSCARGYHVGSFDYAKNWGNRVILVKVNPKNVVSVPNHDCRKMRSCRYWAMKDYDGVLPVDGCVFNENATRIQPKNDDDYNIERNRLEESGYNEDNYLDD